VVERLGNEAIDLFDRFSEESSHPLRLATRPDAYDETVDFENGLESLEPLLLALRRCLIQITRRLQRVYLDVEKLHLKLLTISGETHERLFQIPAATGKVDTLFRVLQTHLESFRTESPIAAAHLSAIPSRPQTRQFALFESNLRDPNQFSETLGRLAALVGSERVGTPHPHETHRPDAFSMRPPELEIGAKPAGAWTELGISDSPCGVFVRPSARWFKRKQENLPF
jgi:protein ImuB